MLYGPYGEELISDFPSAQKGSDGAVKQVSAAAQRDEEYDGFRSVGDSALLTLNTESLFLRSNTMYFLHPLVGRIIDIITDFILGDGLQFFSKDPSVADICEECWTHPINNFSMKEDILTRDHFIFGEKFFTAYVDDRSKDVQFGTLHPFSVQRTHTDPTNPNVVTGVELKSPNNDIFTTCIDPLEPDTKFFSKAAVEQRQGFKVTDPITGNRDQRFVFFYPLNQQQIFFDNTMFQDSSVRGTPELTALFDPLLSADSILTSMVERADAATRILWDVTYTGASKAMCQQYANETPIPDKYTILVHNERIKWSKVDAAQGASEMVELYRALRNYALSGRGCGFPEHWFTEGGATNLATARKMEIAPLKRLRRRQRYTLEMYRRLLQFQVAMKGYDPREVKMVGSTMSQAELHEMALALQQITDSLVKAEAQTWITKEEAAAMYRGTVKDFPGSEVLRRMDPEELRKMQDRLGDTMNDGNLIRLRDQIVDQFNDDANGEEVVNDEN